MHPVAADVARSIDEALSGRVSSLVVYGSAATNDVLPGYSDVDLLVFLQRPLTLADARLLSARFSTRSIAPFDYVQPSFLVWPSNEVRLPPGSFDVFRGEEPPGLAMSADELAQSSRDWLSAAPARFGKEASDWAVTTTTTEHRRARLLMTIVKPTVRALLSTSPEAATEVWVTTWDELVARTLDHERALGVSLAAMVTAARDGADREVAAAAIDVLALVTGSGDTTALS